MQNTQKELFYCYSNRLNTFLGLFGFSFVDKGNNQKGQEYKAYKRTDNLDFALKQWKIMCNKFPIEIVKVKHD